MKKDFLYTQHKRIRIIGPNKMLLRKVTQSLLYIKRVDEKEYAKVVLLLKTVFITNMRGYTNGLYMPENVWMTNTSNVQKVEIEWLAAGFVHEAVHVSQFKNGKYIHRTNSAREKPAIAAQEMFLEKAERLNKRKGKSLVGRATKALKNKYWEGMYKDDRSYDYFDKLLDALCDDSLIMKRA